MIHHHLNLNKDSQGFKKASPINIIGTTHNGLDQREILYMKVVKLQGKILVSLIYSNQWRTKEMIYLRSLKELRVTHSS